MGLGTRALRVFSTRDLILIAIVAALGIAIKPVVVPLAHLVTAPLFIPAGALAGGLYMMWLVVGMGLVGRRGTATLIALVQALLVMLTGVVGSHGVMSLVSYTAPGIVMDLGLLVMGHRARCLRCCFLSGVLANTTGTLMVSWIFFRLPWIPLALALCTAALSGGLGGILAWQTVKLLRRYRLGAAGGEALHDGRRRRGGAPASEQPAASLEASAAGEASRGTGLRASRLSRWARTIGLLVLLCGSLGVGGCSGDVGAAGEHALAAPPGDRLETGSVAFTYGTTGQNGTLAADVAPATDGAVAGEATAAEPLLEVLRAGGYEAAQRVAVYATDGSVTQASAASCALTARGTLQIGGADSGPLHGIILDPPAAAVRDVRGLAQANLEGGGRTLVLYLDGFGYDQYLARRVQGDVPHLAALTVKKAVTVYPTITPVTFAAMVSGCDPAATEVRDRGTHRVACETIFSWAEAAGKTTLLVEGDTQVLELTDTAVLNADASGDGLTDDEVFATAMERVSSSRPDVMLVHFHGIDDVATADGPFAASTIEQTRKTDEMVGRLLAAWDGQAIVVADHGVHALVEGTGEGSRGAHGDFRSEDLFIPLLVREAR